LVYGMEDRKMFKALEEECEKEVADMLPCRHACLHACRTLFSDLDYPEVLIDMEASSNKDGYCQFAIKRLWELTAMPIFEFNCRNCGYTFEELLLREQDKVSCPECGSHSVKKIISMFNCMGVQLNKRLKLESEDQMKKGQEWMKRQKLRKDRIKIM
jgi:putative FmdB family regulatory protein